MMKTIVTLTMNPSIDIACSVEQVIPEIKLRCSNPVYDPGGGGINVARAIHRLGGNALAIFPLDENIGLFFEELLGQDDIDHQTIPIPQNIRESITILETSTALQYRFGMPGPTLEEEDWRRCFELLGRLTPKPTYLVMSGSLPPGVPPNFYAQVVRLFKSFPTQVLLDTSGGALELALETKGLFLIKPNTTELEQLAHHKLPTESQQVDFAKELIRRGTTYHVLLSLAEKGAILITPEKIVEIHIPKIQAVSKVGAGDSLLGGLVLALAKGWPLEQAAQYGVAAGTASVLSPGTGLCNLEDTEKLYQEILTLNQKPTGKVLL
jgi:6-phosphofructokinase 2